ncbi:hypothetical protein SAMN05421780_11312 [Flexibacter flexilis DSM 6793]|uniref:Uncharacterized protein n=1 Tax=Flexibacter flexilis DSM 6793 TaxID=927664 RepID=A0A1I1N748_9BACT|nr:hypothetical protein SAMN05421780_11312 [Flexibacter flexilis DSM 6793]
MQKIKIKLYFLNSYTQAQNYPYPKFLAFAGNFRFKYLYIDTRRLPKEKRVTWHLEKV